MIREAITGFFSSIHSKLVLWIGGLYCLLCLLFGIAYFLLAAHSVQKQNETTAISALNATKVMVEASLNNAVVNYLKQYVLQLDLRFRSEYQQNGALSKEQALQLMVGTTSLVESYLIDIKGNLITPFRGYSGGNNLWNEPDASGSFYIQEMISKAVALSPGQTESVSRLDGGEIYVSAFTFFEDQNWLIVSEIPRSARLFLLNLDVIREGLVGQRLGEFGSIEIFDNVGQQVFHSLRHNEGNIRLTPVYQKIRQMKNGELRTKESFANVQTLSQLETVPDDEEVIRDRLYRFIYLPDIQWYLVVGVDLDELYAPLYSLMFRVIAGCVLFLIFIIVVSVEVANFLLLNDLRKLDDAITRFSDQQFSTRLDLQRHDELGRLSHGFNVMAERIEAYSQQMESQVSEQARQLVETSRMASLGSLVAGFSHEINTPVGIGVTAASHLYEQMQKIKKEIDSGQIKKSQLLGFLTDGMDSAQILESNLENAARLVKSFKVVAIDQSKHQSRTIDLKEYIDDVIASLKHEHKRYHVNFRVDCPSHLMVTCDPSHLYQIFNNLILNSLRHGFTLEQKSEITIHVTLADEQLVVEYRDNGTGIAEEILPHIFEPFFTTKGDSGGSGVGLHVVANIIENLLHGRIDCHSEEGAVFTITLPKSLLNGKEDDSVQI